MLDIWHTLGIGVVPFNYLLEHSLSYLNAFLLKLFVKFIQITHTQNCTQSWIAKIPTFLLSVQGVYDNIDKSSVQTIYAVVAK